MDSRILFSITLIKKSRHTLEYIFYEKEGKYEKRKSKG